MAFTNTLHNVIRRSNKDLLYFYITDNDLFLREFKFPSKWNSSIKLLDHIDEHLINIKIDNNDNIYGIATPQNGEVFYLYTDKENTISKKKLFSFDSEKYELIFPFIMKLDNTLHIMYFFQNLDNQNSWTLFSHYYNGKTWFEYCIDSCFVYPFPSQFTVGFTSGIPTIFYLKDDEIHVSSFNNSGNNWTSPRPITNTQNRKMYFSVLQNDNNSFHMVWSEFINDNLIVRYDYGDLTNNTFASSKIKNLSDPSNCSFPSISRIDNVLWVMWVQLNSLYSCYSTDNGFTWSNPFIDPQSQKNDFIRYDFKSNHKHDLNSFNVDTIFGIYKPKVSFIGFDRSIKA